MFEYKILTPKDPRFAGKFDAQKLEEALNIYAQQGFRVVNCANADFGGMGISRNEFVAILERQIVGGAQPMPMQPMMPTPRR
ncbi:MAG: DUF4177 domain-containing protein [Firmicutes bacterium]|nr:DUF4177 domain-containing protein [Bacillota bacterium]